MAKVFSSKDTHFVLDRNPAIFNQVLEHLRSDGGFRPKQDTQKDFSAFLEELKYWGIESLPEKSRIHDDRSL